MDIIIKDLYKSYGENAVLKSLDAVIEENGMPNKSNSS